MPGPIVSTQQKLALPELQKKQNTFIHSAGISQNSLSRCSQLAAFLVGRKQLTGRVLCFVVVGGGEEGRIQKTPKGLYQGNTALEAADQVYQRGSNFGGVGWGQKWSDLANNCLLSGRLGCVRAAVAPGPPRHLSPTDNEKRTPRLLSPSTPFQHGGQMRPSPELATQGG